MGSAEIWLSMRHTTVSMHYARITCQNMVALALLMASAHPGGRSRSAEVLASWLLQDDFGVDQDDVYEVVAAWNEHSEDVESYVALQEESGLDTEGLREAVRQWRQHKDDYLQYEALRRDTGMDGEGMRKVRSRIDDSRVLKASRLSSRSGCRRGALTAVRVLARVQKYALWLLIKQTPQQGADAEVSATRL